MGDYTDYNFNGPASDDMHDHSLAGLHTSLMTVGASVSNSSRKASTACSPKRSPNSARRQIFDGASEAKLTALACSTPPEGFARWTLQMLESKVVELDIVARASDNTIWRTVKKTFLSRT